MSDLGEFAKKWDPSHTSSIVIAWIRDYDRRMDQIDKSIHAAFVTNDDYKLKTLARRFTFETAQDKIYAFRKWLYSRLKSEQLYLYEDESASKEKGWWSNKYVQSAYKRGISRATVEMDKIGETRRSDSISLADWVNSLFMTPIHLDRVKLIFTRTYTSLKGVSEWAANQMSYTLADGIAKGENPHDIAKNLSDTTNMARVRARRIARTETIRAHHVGAVNTYRQAGIHHVQVVAELATVSRGSPELYEANRVCKECQKLEQQSIEAPFTLDEIESMIPVHPNCRCVAIPRVVPPTSKK